MTATLSKIVADRKELLAVVETCLKAVPTRSTVQVLQCLKFEHDDRGIVVSATDNVLWVQRVCPTICEPFESFCVDARSIRGALSSLSGKDVSIGYDGKLVVVKGGGRYRFATLEVEYFPTWQYGEEEFDFTLPASILSEIKRVSVAASTDAFQPALSTIYFDLSKDVLAASDTHRLHVLPSAGITSEAKGDCLIKPEFFDIIKDFSPSEPLRITKHRDCIRWECEFGYVVISGTFGTFPMYERVIPDDRDKSWTVEKASFIQALRAAKDIASDNARRVVLKSEDCMLHITAKSEAKLGDVDTPVATVSDDSQGLELAANVNYLLDAAEACGTELVRIEGHHHARPFVIVPVDSDRDFLAVVMPMSL
jgi:DNA polymerase-3 subunit beta